MADESEPERLTEVQREQIKLNAEFWNNVGLIIMVPRAYPLHQYSQGGLTWSAIVVLAVGVLGGYSSTMRRDADRKFSMLITGSLANSSRPDLGAIGAVGGRRHFLFSSVEVG